MWPVLMEDATGLRVIDQAIGLAMYDPKRYAHLANDATALYHGPLMTLCPPGWTEERKDEVVDLILATMRGFLMEWQTTRSAVRIDPALKPHSSARSTARRPQARSRAGLAST